MATSQNGWPAGKGAATFSARGVSFPQGVAAGDAAFVLRYVAEQFHDRVEKLHDGWCWGYAYREVRGSSTDLSNHASGTAIDVNAPSHPLATSPSKSFSAAQIATIHKILAEVDGAVRWGGDYTGRQDPMHFEINVSATKLAGVAARLRNNAVAGPATKELDPMIEREFPAAGRYTGRVICPTGSASSIVARAWVSVTADGGGQLAVYFQKASDSDGDPAGAGNPWTGPWKNANRVFAEIPSGTHYLWYDITTNGPGALTIELQAK